MIQALIFDYFGVIRPTDNGVRAAYRRLGGDVAADEAFIADVTTAGNLGFIDDANRQLAERLGVSLERWQQEMGAQNNDTELLDYIAATHKAGQYKTGLLSNASAHMVSVIFDPAEVGKYFDATLVSGDVGLAKPEPDFYRLMAKKLGVAPEECVMVDDRAEYCRGAERAGMKTIEYHHFAQFLTELRLLEVSSDGN